MAIVTTNDQNYKDIAEAIRGKTGKTDLLLPSQMATEISGITGGGEIIENEKYIRPTEWLTLPDRDESKDQVFILVAIYKDTNLPVTINTTGECTISWGDINDTVVTGTVNEFTFTWDSVNPDSLFDLWGYRQSLIEIECDKDLLANLSITSNLDFREFILYANNPILKINGNCLGSTENYQMHFRSEVLNPIFPKRKNIFNLIFENVVFSNGRGTMGGGKLFEIPDFTLNDSSVTDDMVNGQGVIRNFKMEIKNIKSAIRMFQQCQSIVNIEGLTFAENANLTSFLNSCSSLININNLDLSNVGILNSFARNCIKLLSVNITLNKVTNADSIFYGCGSLRSVVINNDKNTIFSMREGLRGCVDLKAVKITNPSSITDIYGLFWGCQALEEVRNANFENARNARSLFVTCPSLVSVYNLNLKSSEDNIDAFSTARLLKNITFAEPQCIKASIGFQNCKSLSAEMLNYIFETGLADLTGQEPQTITITGAGGASECDVTIAQSKNWTVVR